MPKVTMLWNDCSLLCDFLGEGNLHAIGLAVQALVMEAASTAEVKLTLADVDWIPVRCGKACIIPDVLIEIEAIGYPSRKAKLTREVLLQLKRDILAIPLFPKVDPERPLIWIKYWDPDGEHL